MNVLLVLLALVGVAATAWRLGRRTGPPGPPVSSPDEAIAGAAEIADLVRSVAEARDPRRDASPERGRVLLADDDEVNRRVARMVLEKAGFEVHEATDGRDALDRVRRDAFDLVLLDVVMPRLDGLQAASAIRQWEAGQGRIPILAMTGRARAVDVRQCLEAGMDGYVGKPIQAAALVAAVETWILGPGLASGAVDPAPPVDSAALDELRQYGEADPSIVDELVTMFLDGAEQHLASMQEAMRGGDTDSLARVAHTLKGSAGTLGARPLAGLCAELESGARAGQLPPDSSLTAVEREIRRVREYFAVPATGP